MFKVAVSSVVFGVLITGFLLLPKPAAAYTTNMNASVVLGQADFGSNANYGGSGSPNASNFVYPWGICVHDGKLLISDRNINRILIWNSIPTVNNTPADVVLGQANFSTETSGVSATKFNESVQLSCTGGKIFLADELNSRILIWNSIPTVTNTPADVVIGQPNMTANTANNGGIGANTINVPRGVWYDGNKLFVGDSANHRVLIFNSVPTTNFASANVVVGQSNFTANSGATSQCGFNLNFGVYSDGEKLYVSDFQNERFLIFNNIPTTNGACADVVIGQPNFTSEGANQGGSVGPNTISASSGFGVFKDGKSRLFIGDNENNRVLIFNSVPTTNNAYADLVLGQPNMTTNTINYGGVSASSIQGNRFLYVNEDKLFVADTDNHRVLIFDDVIQKPRPSLAGDITAAANGKLRIKGRATVDSLYALSKIEFKVNGGTWHAVTPTDDSFNSAVENFYFDFDKSENGNSLEGYTIRLRAQNTNLDEVDRAFFFDPFVINSPKNDEATSSALPTFDFSVNKQRLLMRDNLQKYQIQIAKVGTQDWKTYIDNIPVDFQSVKNLNDNIRKSFYQNAAINNGVYETNLLTATYSEESSKISVTPKDIVSHQFPFGKKLETVQAYRWKVVAIDKSGKTQETPTYNLKIENPASTQSTNESIQGVQTEEPQIDATGHTLPSPAPPPSPLRRSLPSSEAKGSGSSTEQEENPPTGGRFCIWFIC